MFAKIVGACMLVAGVVMGLKSIGAVVGGILGGVGLVLLLVVIGAALLVGWRLLSGESSVGKVIGAFLVVAGVLGAFPAALSVVVGTIAAVFLAARLIAVVLLLYFGWRWLSTGEFGAPTRGQIRRGQW